MELKAVQAPVVRNKHGQVVSGVLSKNGRAGKDPARKRMQRILDAQVATLIEEGTSAAEFAKACEHALRNPLEDSVFTASVLARVWPAVNHSELSGPDGGPLTVASAEEQARFASDFGAEISSASEDAEDVQPGDSPGAE